MNLSNPETHSYMMNLSNPDIMNLSNPETHSYTL